MKKLFKRFMDWIRGDSRQGDDEGSEYIEELKGRWSPYMERSAHPSEAMPIDQMEPDEMLDVCAPEGDEGDITNLQEALRELMVPADMVKPENFTGSAAARPCDHYFPFHRMGEREKGDESGSFEVLKERDEKGDDE